jgi:hypothetical protein
MAVVLSGSSGLPRDPHLLELFKRLSTLAIDHSFDFKFAHIRGKLNTGPDLLSRNKVENFLSLPSSRSAHRHPCSIPEGLITTLLNLSPTFRI